MATRNKLILSRKLRLRPQDASSIHAEQGAFDKLFLPLVRTETTLQRSIIIFWRIYIGNYFR